MGWQEDNLAPTGIRKLWSRCTHYDGPSAWLVRLNLVITLFAFSPLMLLGVVACGISLHIDNPFFMFAYVLLFVLAEFSYVFLIPTLLAGIVMWTSPKIPLTVKAGIGIVELLACSQLLWFLHASKLAERCGLLGCSH
jgi:hypothetical protein